MARSKGEISSEKALFLFVLALAYGPALGGFLNLVGAATDGKVQTEVACNKSSVAAASVVTDAVAADIVTGAMLDTMRDNATVPHKTDWSYISDGMTIVSPPDTDQPNEEPDCEVSCNADCPTYSDESRPHN